jgi:two-component system response regulator YesN
MMITTANGHLISPKIQRMLAHIHAHYTHTIKLSELALVFHNHPAHLSRRFKRETGISFHQYVSSLRIEKATQLLQSTEKSIKEIGYEVGFTRPEIFSRAFKRCMCCSPTDYRTSTLSVNLIQNYLTSPLAGPNAPAIQMIAEPDGVSTSLDKF